MIEGYEKYADCTFLWLVYGTLWGNSRAGGNAISGKPAFLNIYISTAFTIWNTESTILLAGAIGRWLLTFLLPDGSASVDICMNMLALARRNFLRRW
jgi:hypothetical protein